MFCEEYDKVYGVLCEVPGCVCCHLFMVRLKTARRNVKNVLRRAGTPMGSAEEQKVDYASRSLLIASLHQTRCN